MSPTLFFTLLSTSFVLGDHGDCQATAADVEGPFYLEYSRIDWNLAPEEELQDKSKEIVISGQVFNEKCEKIQGAKVEVWYAGGTPAEYSFPPEEIWYRGQTYTDESGSYSFHLTYPGINLVRPIAHIHFRVTNEDKELVTQLYFPDDVPSSYRNHVRDRASQFPKSVSQEPDGSRRIQFNIVLSPENMAKALPQPYSIRTSFGQAEEDECVEYNNRSRSASQLVYPCVPTTCESAPYYLPYSITDWNIAPPGELQNKSKAIELYGRVFNETCGLILGAKVEVWYGGMNGAYTFPPDKLWYRGQTVSTENGYSFHATFPTIPVIDYKVTTESGLEFFTVLYLSDKNPFNDRENLLLERPTQIPDMVTVKPDGERRIQFDIVIQVGS